MPASVEAIENAQKRYEIRVWTMFFRDPSGNVIELFCYEGFEGSGDLPRGPARGHGNTIDIDALRYDSWSVPGA